MSSWDFKDNTEELTGKVNGELERAMRLVCEKLVGDAKTILRESGHVARGEVLRNIGYEVTNEAGKILGIVGVNANTKYAIFVHEDTKPHFPPVKAIQEWVLYKGLVKSNRKNTSLKSLRNTIIRGRHGKGRDRAMDAYQQSKQIAFLIARKISKKGTKGVAFLRMALNQNIDYIANTLSNIKLA